MHNKVADTTAAVDRHRAALVVWCSSNGTIERIEHDACLLIKEGCGSNFADQVDPSSHDKALLFFEKLQHATVLLDWECTVQLGGTLMPLKLSGIRADGSLLVLADLEAVTLQHILTEAGSLYCLGGAVLTSVVETYGCSDPQITCRNTNLQNEIIRLSNQQAALHRELAKKTVVLESRTEELKELNRVLTTITDGIQDSIMLLDIDGNIIWANKTAQSFRHDHLINCHCHQSLKTIEWVCEPTGNACPITAALASGRPESSEHCYRNLSGKLLYFEITVYPIHNDEGTINQLVRISKNITMRKQLEELLLHETLTDELTGIPNRRAFDKQLATEWRRATRDKSSLTVAIIDIDFFKNYNDLYGHQQGDTCLHQVAHAIKDALRRPGDLAARYGGEEFVIILPGTDVDNAGVITDAIRANLELLAIPHLDSAVSRIVTVSIGVAAAVPTQETTAYTLLQSADKALYAAKRLGRNRVHRFV